MIEPPDDLRSKKELNLKIFDQRMEKMRHKVKDKKVISVNNMTPDEEKRAMRALKMFNKMTLEQDKLEICQKGNHGNQKLIFCFFHSN